MKRNGFKIGGLGLLPGLLLFLSIPPFGLFPLSYVSLWPVLYVLTNAQISKPQKWGFAIFHTWVIGICIHFWIYFACVDFGGLSPSWGVLATCAFGLIANLEFFIAMAAALLVKQKKYQLLVYFMAFVITQKLLPLKLFPWSIASPQVQMPWLASSYFFVGTLGMLIISFFMNVALLKGWRIWRVKDRKAMMRWSVQISCVVMLLVGFYVARSNIEYRNEKNVSDLKVLMIQGNIANAIKLSAEQGMISAIYKSVLTYQNITDQALSRIPKEERKSLFVFWPETSYPIAYSQERDSLSASVDQLQKDWMNSYEEVQFIFGTYGYKHYRPNGIQNQMVWVQDQNHVHRYTKQHLLAFGEFLPFRNWLPTYLERLWPYEDFSSGPSRKNWLLSSDIRALPNICYEVLFDDLSLDRFLNQSNLLLNVTNDGWWSNKVARETHLLMVRERAAVAGVPIVRITNTGISAWVTSWGQAMDRLVENSEQAKLISIPVPVSPWGPIYWGHVQKILGWLSFVLFLIWLRRNPLEDL
jgi:apolipoprotein N-acyltransferase